VTNLEDKLIVRIRNAQKKTKNISMHDHTRSCPITQGGNLNSCTCGATIFNNNLSSLLKILNIDDII